MWCSKCHFGSVSLSIPSGRKCPMCGSGIINVTKNPFDKKPSGMGSGKKFHAEEIEDASPKVEKIVKTTKEPQHG